jgi:AraC-like DNA-binding protein
MQNRPFLPYNFGFDPIELNGEFPIATGGVIEQIDRPVVQLHRHDCLEVGYCHEGEGVFVVEDKVLPFSEGDVAIITEEEMHLARSLSGTTSPWTFLFFRPTDFFDTEISNSSALQTHHLKGDRFTNIIDAKRHPDISGYVRIAIEELNKKSSGYQAMIRGILKILFVKIHRIFPPEEYGKKVDRSSLERLSPALECIANNFEEELPVPYLAERCFMSVTNFRRVFLKTMGVSPQEYLIRFRIKMAARLLQSTSRSILDISYSVGYRTLSSFNRHFKRIMKVAPREWRNQ